MHHPLLWADITSELLLLRLALDLGADRTGGPLSVEEEECLRQIQDMPPTPDVLIERARHGLSAGGDPLGDILCRLRPAPVRRKSGSFYTPPALVEAMLAWLLERQPDCLVDPGCGSGRFVVTATRRLPDLPVIAIDLDPVSTMLTRAALAVVGARQARVLQGDYLTSTLPRRRGRTGFIANPPYVRHHDLAPTTKAWASLAGLRVGIPVSALAGLHTLFLLATVLHAHPGDVGCFITSAEWLDTRYGEAMRRLLVERLGLHTLAVIDPAAMPFADVMTTAALSGFTVGAAFDQIATDLIDRPMTLDLNALRHTVSRQQLAAARRWSPELRSAVAPGPLLPPENGSPTTVPLGTIARVHRGVATGANEFFVLTREQAQTLGLMQWCRPAITRAQELIQANGVVHDGPARRLLLVVPPDVDRRAHPALDAYLRQGEESIAQRYLPSHRRPWWYLGPLVPPPIIVSYMARQAPVFALNPDGLLLLNIAHGIYPHQPLDEVTMARLVEQLNRMRETFRGGGRTYQGGLEKFEPREMEALPVALEGITDAAVRSTPDLVR